MSGGHFDYVQYRFTDPISSIKNEIEYGEWTEETKQRFQEGIKALEIAATYLHRIDWLISGDDGEETFHIRLTQDMKELE